jgi:short-subunit dehydrogenase
MLFRNQAIVDLKGQFALITGASQGLGYAFAEEFARLGMNLILVALPGQALPESAAALSRAHNIRVDAIELDLTATDSVERLVAEVSQSSAPVSVLVNNAGVGYNRRFDQSTLRENEACILLNNLALVKLTRLMLPVLRQQPRAYLLNVASLAAFFPMPYMPVYAPSKAFITQFSLGLREELRGTPLTVSVLCPNGIRTNPENRAKIEAGGWAARLTCLDADQVARAAVHGLLHGKATIVPGALNQLIAAVGRYTPRSLVFSVVSAFWGKTARPSGTFGG